METDMMILKRFLRIAARKLGFRLNDKWPPDLSRVTDWECGFCGARKSEIVSGKSYCASERGCACPMWPIYEK